MRTALASGRLPPAAQDAGERLLRRLSAPVRLAIFGLRGTGKARVRDVLAGCTVLPPEAHTASVELVYGSREQGRLIRSDGSERGFDGAASATTDWGQVALVRLQRPLPVLERISLLEVVADSPGDDPIAALSWAVRRCDMMLWCTRDFTEQEQTAWATVPDRIRDHTFLVPQLPRGGLFPGGLREEVLGLLPLHRDPGPGDGASALRAAVLAHVDHGRIEDFDGALMFLERFRPFLSAGTEAAAPVRAGWIGPERRRAVIPDVDPGPEGLPGRAEAVRSDDAAAPPLVPAQDTEVAPATSRIEPKPAPDRTVAHLPVPRRIAGPAQPVDDSSHPPLSSAFETLRAAARSIARRTENPGPDWPQAVLDLCLATVEALPSLPPDESDLCDVIGAASDLMLLLHLEADPAAAADAVSLLVQVRQAVELRLAA